MERTVRADSLKDVDLVVVKVGTSTLITEANAHGERFLDHEVFENIGQAISFDLEHYDHRVLLVSSAAITAGMIEDDEVRDGTEDTVDEQRYAARGWGYVVEKWQSVIEYARITPLLLTKKELHIAKMRQNALRLMSRCFELNDVVLVNNNDTISDDEIKYSDNDQLAADLAIEIAKAGMFRSVRLVLLTDKRGLLKDPEDDESLIRRVTSVDDVEGYVIEDTDPHTRGGMKSKLQAIRRATKAGIKAFIVHGKKRHAVEEALLFDDGTYFVDDSEESMYTSANRYGTLRTALPEGYTFSDREDIGYWEVKNLFGNNEWFEEKLGENESAFAWLASWKENIATVGVRDSAGTLVGIGNLQAEDHEQPLVSAELSSLIVNKEHRQKGIGTAIIMERLRIADMHGVRLVTIPYFEETNTAANKYQGFGFTTTSNGGFVRKRRD